MDKLPYLTAELAGIGGKFKAHPEDFYVEEIPRYQPSGQGQHTYLRFEKTGMTTLAAINRIAQALSISPKAIGYAGLKDANAVTQQTISINEVSPESVQNLDLVGIRILEVARHRNKLKVGHLAGNRFKIRVSDVTKAHLPQVESLLARLQQIGIPNYFGEQRFGVRDNSHWLGLALMQEDYGTFLAELLGKPHPDEMSQAQQARQLFDDGDWAAALEAWPKSLRTEWLVLKKLIETDDPVKAVYTIDKRLIRLYVSAYQSFLFNKLLAERLATISQIEVGDIAYIHRNGATFLVESAEAEQPRVDRLEISPAGPLFGVKYLPATAEPGWRETALLKQSGLTLDSFNMPGVRLTGGRRPYRIPITDVAVDWRDGLLISFSLPSGGYATMVLRELMKND